MPDREEVLQGLECCIRRLEGQRVCDECPYDEDFNCLGCSVVLWQAIALLKEQEPVSVGFTNGVYHCGNCGEPLFDNNIFCHKCGRKVEWGDDGDA